MTQLYAGSFVAVFLSASIRPHASTRKIAAYFSNECSEYEYRELTDDFADFRDIMLNTIAFSSPNLVEFMSENKN